MEIDTPDGRVIVAGDLGNRESAIQDVAVQPRERDGMVLIETTYADRCTARRPTRSRNSGR